jgi:uncharacterized membrane protein
MDALDLIVLFVLRVAHILFGIMWIGAGLFMYFIISPTMQKMRSGEIVNNIVTHSRYSLYMALSAIVTVVAGVLLYIRVYSADWLSTGPGRVLTIGAIAGILAFGHGATAMPSAMDRLNKLGQEIATGGGPPSQDQLAALNDLQGKMTLHSRISLALGLIAVVGMAGARFFIV